MSASALTRAAVSALALTAASAAALTLTAASALPLTAHAGPAARLQAGPAARLQAGPAARLQAGPAARLHNRGQPASATAATALLNRAFADARAKGSFHQALTQTIGGVRGTLQDDVTLTAGRQAIASADGTRAEVEVSGGTAYISGNQHALRSYFKFTSSQAAVIGSNWVAIPSTNRAFASIAYDVTVPTALTEVAPSGHLTEGPPTSLDGQRVIAVSGGVPAAFAGGSNGRATIYITASSDPLPVRATMSEEQANHSKLTLAGTMSNWGERVAVVAPVGQSLSTGQVTLLARRLAGLSIPGEPGYFAVTGQQGHPVPIGRPWGQACKPVRFAIGSAVPGWVRTQITAVVDEARRQGIDVTVGDRHPGWRNGSLYYRGGQTPATTARVAIVATGTTPSTTKSRLPMQLAWSSRLDGDKHNEDLTSVTAALSLPSVDGRRQTVRRSIRQLIAFTQGISETTDPISGITLRHLTDRFTNTDLRAMLDMSGCARAPSTVIGIAA